MRMRAAMINKHEWSVMAILVLPEMTRPAFLLW